jgi:hypothetical protein
MRDALALLAVLAMLSTAVMLGGLAGALLFYFLVVPGLTR